MSDYGQHYSEDSSTISTISTNQHEQSAHNPTENLSGCVSGNTIVACLPVSLSTSHHHDQHSHHQECGQEKKEEYWGEEGEEYLGEVNGTDSWVEDQEGLAGTSLFVSYYKYYHHQHCHQCTTPRTIIMI